MTFYDKHSDVNSDIPNLRVGVESDGVTIEISSGSYEKQSITLSLVHAVLVREALEKAIKVLMTIEETNRWIPVKSMITSLQ